MTNYTTRVELHQASAEDYRQLIRAMKKEAFITGKDGAVTGPVTFKKRGKVEMREVINAVVKAAASTGRKFSFTVMKDKPADRPEYGRKLAWQ